MGICALDAGLVMVRSWCLVVVHDQEMVRTHCALVKLSEATAICSVPPIVQDVTQDHSHRHQ